MNWTVLGINYHKANIEQRQKYALNDVQINSIYDLFREQDIANALIISTCNRTEFFIPSFLKEKVIDLLNRNIYKNEIDANLFHYKEDDEALAYFFRICSGLESQIVGDFEILGQVKKACALAKDHKMLSGLWEKTINNGLAAAKKARTNTGFYSGASSTSYACIEHLKSKNLDLKNSKYLVIGTGKIGTHTIDHLVKLVDSQNIFVSNRSIKKALELSHKKNLGIIPFQHLSFESAKFDVIICATNSPVYVIGEGSINSTRKYHIIDLSLPLNVDPKLREYSNVDLVNIDELSAKINENIERRDGERKNVEAIVDESIKDLKAWFTIKSGIPMLAELRSELEQLKNDALSNIDSDNIEHSTAFLDQYTNELFDQFSQKWIRKVRNKPLDAN